MTQRRRQQNFTPSFGSGADLISLLRRIDRSSYGSYKKALGTWDFGDYQVIFDRIQADPYAPPSAVRIQMRRSAVALPAGDLRTRAQKVATADFLARGFAEAARSQEARALSIARCGQEILERSSASVLPDHFELRIAVRLPARGRTILGREAARIFESELPGVLTPLFDFSAQEYLQQWRDHVHSLEDHEALTQYLDEQDLVAFVANGAMLARASGISEAPLVGGVPFESPPSLEREVVLPRAGTVRGMGVPPGVTVIVGGGYHGKSTLLSAIQRGVYAHVPGDGRELVATKANAMKIRAADGRPVTKVDVSPFINHLPADTDTAEFSTQNASGSTSQAASLVEALGMFSDLLLLDEDTSATNLLIRDSRMRELVVAAQEPITPLVDRIAGLSSSRGTSILMVMGGSSAYLEPADLVLQMNSYRCADVTARAHSIVASDPRATHDIAGFPELRRREVVRQKGTAMRPKTKSSGTTRIEIDRETIDVADVEQIVDPGQAEAIAWAVRGIVEQLAAPGKTLWDLAEEVEDLLEEEGLDALRRFGSRSYPAFLVRPRPTDIAAAVNRLRSLKITSKSI